MLPRMKAAAICIGLLLVTYGQAGSDSDSILLYPSKFTFHTKFRIWNDACKKSPEEEKLYLRYFQRLRLHQFMPLVPDVRYQLHYYCTGTSLARSPPETDPLFQWMEHKGTLVEAIESGHNNMVFAILDRLKTYHTDMQKPYHPRSRTVKYRIYKFAELSRNFRSQCGRGSRKDPTQMFFRYVYETVHRAALKSMIRNMPVLQYLWKHWSFADIQLKPMKKGPSL
ncbi:hypothetical protein H4R35_005718 [Dimargaris xerosporica]|nr:hypothetical protein H4R35_005718 [Dimargaris xerosporica]